MDESDNLMRTCLHVWDFNFIRDRRQASISEIKVRTCRVYCSQEIRRFQDHCRYRNRRTNCGCKGPAAAIQQPHSWVFYAPRLTITWESECHHVSIVLLSCMGRWTSGEIPFPCHSRNKTHVYDSERSHAIPSDGTQDLGVSMGFVVQCVLTRHFSWWARTTGPCVLGARHNFATDFCPVGLPKAAMFLRLVVGFDWP